MPQIKDDRFKGTKRELAQASESLAPSMPVLTEAAAVGVFAVEAAVEAIRASAEQYFSANTERNERERRETPADKDASGASPFKALVMPPRPTSKK